MRAIVLILGAIALTGCIHIDVHKHKSKDKSTNVESVSMAEPASRPVDGD